ncbi:MAG TPA: AAA family ATPase [Solirubrobacteraceae bacterium]|jgi:DNA-binding NarL/FixJ family response regulator|nr:AAA family ATPase [Solirubrobacteraceae bacterium]
MRPLTSSQLVGRVGELAELELACREAAAGRPSIVLLRGESGVGKTRLIAELEHRLSGSHPAPLLLRGEAVEHGETELPYTALLGALRPLVRERDPVFDRLSSGSRGQLAALLPTLDDGRGAGDSDDGSGQLRLFEALLELLEELSEIRPVVLCLEDIHWADQSTRTFIAYLSRSLRQERIVLLLSYRSDELHRRHPLRPLISELERLERARRVDLQPFDRAELTEVLRDILGDAPDDALVGRLLVRSEGNPLYIEELLAAGLDGRGAAPQSLQDAFLLRIERLSPDAQRAARAIAVGRELNERVVGELTDIDPGPLALALREALAEQVLRAGDDGFSFRHELLREALYDDLLPGERGELHLALARELERTDCAPEDGGVEHSATIARHYEAAGDQPAALRATVVAALSAIQVHAYGEAADLAERALELWPRVLGENVQLDLPRGDTLDHVALLQLAARAHSIGSDRARGEVLLQSALRELDPETDARRYATVLARQARMQWALNRGPQGIETAQRALAMLGEEDGGRERAALLGWLARTRVLRGRFRDAVDDGERALAAAVAAGDSYVQGEVLNTLGMAQMALGDVERGAAQLRRAQAIARGNDDIDSLATAYSNLADFLLLCGRTREALAVADEGLAAIPARLGRSHDWLKLTASQAALEAGDLAAARAHLGPTSTRAVGIQLMFRLLRLADLALAVGDDEGAEQALRDAQPLVADSSEPQWIGLLGSMLAEWHRRHRRLPEARAAVAAALDRLEVCTDDVMRIARVSAIGARVEADFAQRGRDLREKAMVREAVTRARLHAQRLRAAAQDGGPVEQAWNVTGAAELARARGRQDPKAWAKTAEVWQAIERPYQVILARWREAEAEVERGERADAARVAQQALAQARELEAGWPIREIEALQERARLEPARVAAAGPAVDGNGRAPDAPVEPDPFGLTPRERQVLALVAEGATNRQIGAALFMAEKTASVHVSRILGKLGVQSRTQAAAVAHRLHLG